MKTQEFLDLLEQNPGKNLVFEYAPDQIVPNGYHITEVKNIVIDSVDCGGNVHFGRDTVVQLWNGTASEKDPMATDKALSIFNIVNSKKSLFPDAPIGFEYGNPQLSTSVFRVEKVENTDELIRLKMFVPQPECKPRSLLKVLEGAVQEACCTPSSGCC